MSIIMSASEMLALVIYFPILVGYLVSSNEAVWDFYLVLYTMFDILVSRTISESSISYLKSLIAEHHQLYCHLFEQTLKPKFHILLHYLRILKKVGPIRHIWVMRYEAFHKQLKATAIISHSRVYLLLTLCIKQQLKLSHRFLSRKGLSNPIECRQFIAALHDIKEIRLQSVIKASNITFSEEAHAFGSIKIDNIKYNIRNVLQLNDTEFNILLKFGLLMYILLDKKSIIFILSPLTTVTFQNHLQAYEISINKDTQWLLIHWDNLANKFPYNIHMMGNGKHYIVPLQ